MQVGQASVAQQTMQVCVAQQTMQVASGWYCAAHAIVPGAWTRCCSSAVRVGSEDAHNVTCTLQLSFPSLVPFPLGR